MKAKHCYFRVLRAAIPIATLLVCLSAAQATNLRFGRVMSPTKTLYRSPFAQALRVFCRNDSTFDATNFTVVLSVLKLYPTISVVMSEIVKVSHLAKRDSVLISSEKTWIPSDSGSYQAVFSVNYIDDVVPSDNNLTMDFKVYDRPLGYAALGQYNIESPFTQKNSSLGLFTATLPPLTSNKFINVVAYPASQPKGVWLIQNMAFPSSLSDTSSISQFVDFTKLGYKRGASVDSTELFYSVSDSGWASPQTATVKEIYQVPKLDYHLGFTPKRSEKVPDLRALDSTTLQWYSPVTLTNTVTRETMPNIDLDSTLYNPGTKPGYAGDKNACVPAAAANSLHWLELSHQFIDTTVDLRSKLVQLSSFLNREREQGATALELVQAKLAYIDKYKLPIHVKFQSFYISMDSMTVKSPDPRYGHEAMNKSDTTFLFPRPSTSFLMSEMQHGEDVECIVGWYNLNETNKVAMRRYGHAFTLSGSGMKDGKPYIVSNDDADQKKAGGTVRVELALDDSSDVGGPVIPSMGFVDNDGATLTCILESVVSESYDSTITYNSSGINSDTPSKIHCSILSSDNKASSLVIDVELAGLGSYRIFDSKGALLYESPSFMLQQGKNVLSLESTTQLAQGVYYVNTITAHGEATTVLVK